MTSSGSASKCPRCGSPEAGDDHRCDTDPEVGPETKHLEEQGSIPLMLTSPVSGSFAEHPTVPIDGHAQSARLAADLPTYDIRTPDRRPRSPAKQLGPLSGSKLRHFRLAELLGKGGMGFVYRAIDEKLHREVALKVLPPDLASDPERRARLIVEARAAAAVAHANVAAVYEVEEDGDQVFIAMELVEGETLRERMAMGLTLQDAVGLALQIAKGISRAHEKGVLHRDLKPDNILVGSDGEVKILDFGLAKRVDVEDVARVIDGDAELTSGITQAGVVMGTPGYMSPEQILNDTIDHRSDIFALGVVLYEMVTQLHPFRGRVNEMLRNTLTVTPTAPSELNPSVSPELEAVIMGALARRREDRTASARDIVRELTRIAGIGAPGSALLPSRKDAAQTTSRMSVQRPSSLLEGRVTLLASVQQPNTGSLAGHASYTRDIEVTLPAGIEGQYYIYVFANVNPVGLPGILPWTVESGDGNFRVGDPYEFYYSRAYENPLNNMGQAALPVIYREPDLRVTDLQVTVQGGKAIAIAQTRQAKAKAYPNVPTMAESGFPGFEATTWYGLVGPGRMPVAMAKRMNEDVNKALQMPDVIERLVAHG